MIDAPAREFTPFRELTPRTRAMSPESHDLAAWLASYYPELLTLIISSSLLAVMVPRHEPWADEAQAWQIARSLPYGTMMFRYLGYEGAPGLWYTLLWILTRAGVTYSGMQWFSAGIALIGITIFLFSAPFPRYVRLAFPYTFFIAYQYAVVARSYVLFPILLFLALRVWPKKRERPIVFAALLGLIANISLHTAMVSIGLAFAAVVELWRESSAISDLANSRFLAGVCLLLALYSLAVVVARPPADQNFFSNPVMRTGVPSPAIDKAATTTAGWSAATSITADIGKKLLSKICGPGLPSDRPLFNLLFWIVFCAAFLRRDLWIYAVPALLFLGFSTYLYAAFHHCGIVYLTVVAALWLTWEKPPSRMLTILCVFFLLVSCEQIAWTIAADKYDFSHPYSPDRSTAEFLKPYVDASAKIVAVGAPLPCYSAGLQPYFDHNIYSDQQLPFWWWSARNRSASDIGKAISGHPDVVLVEFVATEPYSRSLLQTIRPDYVSPEVAALEESGYHRERTFCGTRPEGFRLSEWICHLVFMIGNRDLRRVDAAVRHGNSTPRRSRNGDFAATTERR